MPETESEPSGEDASASSDDLHEPEGSRRRGLMPMFDAFSTTRTDRHTLLERRLLDFDRGLVSDGLRLILVLPTISILLHLSAWVWLDRNPRWLADANPNTFSIVALALAATAALMAVLVTASHRIRLRLSSIGLDRLYAPGSEEQRSLTAHAGHDLLKKRIQQVLRAQDVALGAEVLAFSLIVACALVLGVASSEGILPLLLLALGANLMGIGTQVSTSGSDYNSIETWGLLGIYDPPSHPSMLDHPMTDVFTAHMDPALRFAFDDFMQQAGDFVKEDMDVDYVREKLLLTLYFHANGLDRASLLREVGEVIEDEGIDRILQHPVFTMEVWLSIIEHVKERIPSFFRMVDRLRQDMEHGHAPALDDLVFDLDMENIVSGRGHLFTTLQNFSDTARDVVLRVQSPDFRPNDLTITYHLPASSNVWWTDYPTPIASEGNDDIVGRLTGMLWDGVASWYTMLPEHTGAGTVTVRLEEPNGDLLIGRQINVSIRRDFRSTLTNVLAVTLFSGGGLVVLVGLLLQFFILQST